jgi:hypothetical protein
MEKFKFYFKKYFLTAIIVLIVIFCFSTFVLDAEESENDLKALKLIRKAKSLRLNQRLGDALSKFTSVTKLTDNKKIVSRAYLEIAYIKFLQRESLTVYRKYIELALNLNPSLELGGYYDKKFKDEFKRLVHKKKRKKVSKKRRK